MRQNSFYHTLTNSHVLLSILIFFISMVNVKNTPLILRLRHALEINWAMGPAHSPSSSLTPPSGFLALIDIIGINLIDWIEFKLLRRVSSLSSRESEKSISIELSSNYSVGFLRFHRENQRNQSRLNRVHSVGFTAFN